MRRHTLAALALATLAAPALAHHGWSEYDSTQPLTLTGKIVESGYEHPHGHIKLQTPDKTWNAVLAPPTRMENRGLPRDALKVGNTATVMGYPNRNKPDEMRAERITVEGKTNIFMKSGPCAIFRGPSSKGRLQGWWRGSRRNKSLHPLPGGWWPFFRKAGWHCDGMKTRSQTWPGMMSTGALRKKKPFARSIPGW